MTQVLALSPTNRVKGLKQLTVEEGKNLCWG